MSTKCMINKLKKPVLFAVTSAFLLGSLTPALAKSTSPITLAECQQLSPVAMAEQSDYVMNSYNYLLQVSEEIADPGLRGQVTGYIKNPVASVLQRFKSDADKEVLKQQLVAAGYIKADATYDQFLPPVVDVNKPAQPFYSTPGSGYASHHAYPGGLVTHTAANVKTSLGIYNGYIDVYGFKMNKDVVLAAELMHDMNKPWVFQWQADYALTPQYGIAGTGSHHILSIAEAIYRGFPKDVVIAMAYAHTPAYSSQDEKQIADWIKAAAMIAGKDPLALGLLDPETKGILKPPSMEGFVTHLGDHDYVMTEPMSTWLIKKLGDIAKAEYGMTEADLKTAKFNAFRDYILSQLTTERLYSIMATQGDAALTDAAKLLVTR